MVRYTDDELAEMGIRRENSGYAYQTLYIYKCPKCGNDAYLHSLITNRPVYCAKCKKEASEQRQWERLADEKINLMQKCADYEDFKYTEQFEKATKVFEGLGDYARAIKAAKQAYKKFDSLPEAVAAIALLHAGFRIIPQQKVSGFRVDFAIPKEKFVIEVDGSLYHKDKGKQALRDESLRYNLGLDWQVIHVPADAIMKAPVKFEKAIKEKCGQKADF